MSQSVATMEQIGNGAEHAFERLPILVYYSILKYLDEQSIARLKRTCSQMKWVIEQEYGIHVRLPARTFHNWVVKDWKLQRAGKQVTDNMILDVISGMKDKVVRSLQMNEMPPRLDPFPLHRFLSSPGKLVRVFMKYVDVKLLESTFGLCRNLHTFTYSTGNYRPLPQGTLSILSLLTSFEPVRIPSKNEKFLAEISKSPSSGFNLNQLTNFTLMMIRLNTSYHSDWANCLYLLLSLSQSPLPSMKKFVFYTQPEIFLEIKDSIQILACIGQFLSQCMNLIKFEHISYSCSYNRHYLRVTTSSNFPQNVLSGLIDKFGTELVKEVKEERRLQNKELMMEPLKRIFEHAGRSLPALREVHLQITDMCEGEVFKEFLMTLPSLRCLNIIDVLYGWTEPASDIFHFLLFSQQETNDNYPFYDTLETLSIKSLLHPTADFMTERSWQTVSLVAFFSKMRALTSLEVHERGAYAPDFFTPAELPMFIEFPPPLPRREPNFPEVLDNPNEERDEDEINLPNVERVLRDFAIFEIGENPLVFQNVRVLKLYCVRLLPQHTKKFIFFTGLRTLILKFSVECWTGCGMYGQHLIKLMSNLRKLEMLEVSRVIITQNNQERAMSIQRLLESVGHLKYTDRNTWNQFYYDFRFTHQEAS